MNKILVDIPEVIETKNLILQMPKAGYGEQLHAAILDGYEDYIYWLHWSSTPPTVEQVEIDCRMHHAQFITRELIRYLIIEQETQKVVGRCAFPDFQANWAVPLFGISYFISKSSRGKGYASEASRALALLAFNTLGAKKVEIYCDSKNKASQSVPKKLGFELEYVAKGDWPSTDDKLAEIHCYSLFSPDDLKID